MKKAMRLLTAWMTVTMLSLWLPAEGVAMAANPTTRECLAASSASLQSAADHKLRLERDQLSGASNGKSSEG